MRRPEGEEGTGRARAENIWIAKPDHHPSFDRPAEVVSLDHARPRPDLKARAADTKALLGRQMSLARRLLRALLETRLRCEAVSEGARRGYRVAGTGNYLPLLPEFGCSVEGGVPNGTQRTTERPLSFTIDLPVVAA